MGPLYHFLGLSVGIIQGQSQETGDTGGTFIYDPEYRHPDPRYDFARPAQNRRAAYACDITYGTNNEYGFDYLRDNLAVPGQELAQPELTFAIVDEVDSILVDEARTPLIISGQAEASSDLYVKMDRIIRQLQNERDYKIEEKQKTAVFSEDGTRRVELALGVQNLSDPENLSLMQHASAALKAHAVWKRDVDYLVKKNEEGKEEVVIIDENTGRLMFGRRWSDGLHQAVEAKEGVKIENENQTLATITFQNLFRLYPKLGGMTGTAKTEEDEFRKIYALDVVQVPTNKPMIRQDLPDIIYKSQEAKLRGIAREILTLFTKQQPVLVGTRSVEMSERVSDRLRYDRLQLLALTDLLIERIDLPDERIVIACIAVAGNPGMSITNAVEEICFQVCERFEIAPDRLVWLEHYDDDEDDEWHIVRFGGQPPEGPFLNPTWTAMTPELWASLRLKPKKRLLHRHGSYQSKLKKLFPWPTEDIG